MPQPRLLQSSALGPGENVSITLSWNVSVLGTLFLPKDAQSLVMFAHGSGFCGPDSVHLARILHQFNIATLLFDLLTAEEAQFDAKTEQLRSDTVTLGDRLVAATIWLEEQRDLRKLELGLLGDDAGAAAAMIVAARLPQMIKALALRSGNLDAAKSSWPFVKAPTLLLIGNNDPYKAMNEAAYKQLPSEKSLQVVEGCDDLLCDSTRLDFAGNLAAAWFAKYLNPQYCNRVAG